MKGCNSPFIFLSKIKRSVMVRNLKTKDLFTLSKIYSKIDTNFEIKPGMSQAELGIEIANKIMGNFHKADTEIIEFRADLKGTTVKEIEDLSLSNLFGVIKELIELEGLGDFLRAVVS